MFFKKLFLVIIFITILFINVSFSTTQNTMFIMKPIESKYQYHFKKSKEKDISSSTVKNSEKTFIKENFQHSSTLITAKNPFFQINTGIGIPYGSNIGVQGTVYIGNFELLIGNSQVHSMNNSYASFITLNEILFSVFSLFMIMPVTEENSFTSNSQTFGIRYHFDPKYHSSDFLNQKPVYIASPYLGIYYTNLEEESKIIKSTYYFFGLIKQNIYNYHSIKKAKFWSIGIGLYARLLLDINFEFLYSFYENYSEQIISSSADTPRKSNLSFSTGFGLSF
jgi:hypothetical protein